MLESTKIKLLGVVGTFTIISTSYLLHAKTFYNEIYSTVDIKEITSTASTPAIEPLKIETPAIVKPQETVVVETVEPIKSEMPIITEPKKASISSSSNKLDQLLKQYKYLHVQKSGEISQDSKEALEKIVPLLADINNSYIELEGHSATEASSALSQKISEQYADSIYRYLNDKKINKEIVVTGYGDLYPILDNTKDKQNSRVMLKIRRR